MFYQWDGEDLILSCQIKPGARQDGFVDTSGDSVKIQVAAAPVDGKANRHLIKFLSRQFKTPQRNIHIEKGCSGRNKRVRICAAKRLPPELELSD